MSIFNIKFKNKKKIELHLCNSFHKDLIYLEVNFHLHLIQALKIKLINNLIHLIKFILYIL